jgi:hypothetical protein
MKAFLAWHDVPVRKTHSLEELGRLCVALDSTLGSLADEAAPLTEYAVLPESLRARTLECMVGLASQPAR